MHSHTNTNTHTCACAHLVPPPLAGHLLAHEAVQVHAAGLHDNSQTQAWACRIKAAAAAPTCLRACTHTSMHARSQQRHACQ